MSLQHYVLTFPCGPHLAHRTLQFSPEALCIRRSPQQKQPSPMKTTLNMRPLRASPAAAVDAADDATVPTPEEFQVCHPVTCTPTC